MLKLSPGVTKQTLERERSTRGPAHCLSRNKTGDICVICLPRTTPACMLASEQSHPASGPQGAPGLPAKMLNHNLLFNPTHSPVLSQARGCSGQSMTPDSRRRLRPTRLAPLIQSMTPDSQRRLLTAVAHAPLAAHAIGRSCSGQRIIIETRKETPVHTDQRNVG